MAESQEAGSGGSAQAAGELAARQRRLQSYLPGKVVDAFRDAGVTRDLYQWQVRCTARSVTCHGCGNVSRNLLSKVA